MATKDDRPGLLSKVAKFVRNPTKDWSELDRPEPDQESGYDKQALKAMIERKRQNDFVRKREFDQLRKLRNRDPSSVAGVARPSYFQNSLSTDQDGRAVTLKKIDEIEAQMSKQWWKGKHDGSTGQAGFPVATAPSIEVPAASASARTSPTALASRYESTESSGLHSSVSGAALSEYAATQMGSGMPPPMSSHVPLSARVPLTAAVSGAVAGTDLSFSTSELFAIDAEDMATDPELEEAAIRFANGDDAGAETGLLNALRGVPSSPEASGSWAAALMDLYRATNNRARFDWAVVELSHIWGGVVPTWFALADPLQPSRAMSLPFVAGAAGDGGGFSGVIWSSPSRLSEQAMEDLREAMSTQPMPWVLDWTALASIDAFAMPLLGGLFGSLCEETVAVQFGGANSLVQALRASTPSGDRAVDPTWWTARLNALRAMQMLDEFELAALDYCVTYEVSPPAWEPARCQYAPAEAVGPAQGGAPSSIDPGATVPMGLDSPGGAVMELRGDVLGDAAQALAALDASRDGGARIVVSCRCLIRVDFSAAGSILNWVAQRESEGHLVQFQDVHRLVAAFFNVIGINEHARVVPRAM